MKKFISIALTFVIILSALPIVSTSAITSTESKTGAANDTAISALDYEEGTYPPEEMPTEPKLEPTYCPIEPTTQNEPICELRYNELSDGTLEVCGFTNNTGSVDLVIPSEHNGKTVTRIADSSFKNNTDIISVTIPETITYIGSSAFGNCGNLKVINFNAKNCIRIGNYSTSYENFTVQPAFDNCAAVETINFGANVGIIPHFAFWGVSQIEEITIPEKVIKIGGLVFGSAQIGTMHYGATDCSETGISWHEVDGWGEGAQYEYFSRKPFYNIENLIITSTVNQIPDNMFNCLGIKELYLPDSIKQIKENAFIGCTNLATIRFPEHLDSIGSGAFDNTAWFDSQPSGCVYIKNVLYKYKGSEQQKNIVVKEGTTEIVGNAFFDAENIQSVSLPDTLVSIGDSAFSGCSGINEIIIPNNVTLLGKSVFIGCSNLTKVTLSKKLKAIDDSSFRNCTNLESITIPDSVEKIGHYAFTNCVALRSISFGNELRYIGFSCFEGCTQLAKVDIPNIEVWFNIGFVYYISTRWNESHSNSSNPLYNGSKLYVNGILLTELTINKADTVRPYLFCNYKDLKKVIINCAVDRIGDYAFYNCAGLEEVRTHKNVPIIGGHAFWNCPKLKDIYIYNPTCQIINNYETISGSAVIHGYDGSTAQLYAGNYNRTFMLIEDEPTVLGDVDGDGAVSIIDATCIQRHLAEIPVYA